ncbi:hypothetical protein BDV27DRAFT_136892, partial [Aspergillus caelatus]
MVLDIGNVPMCRGDGSYRHGARTFLLLRIYSVGYEEFHSGGEQKKKRKEKKKPHESSNVSGGIQKRKGHAMSIERNAFNSPSLETSRLCMHYMDRWWIPRKACQLSRRAYDIKLYPESETRCHRPTPAETPSNRTCSSFFGEIPLLLSSGKKAYVPF